MGRTTAQLDIVIAPPKMTATATLRADTAQATATRISTNPSTARDTSRAISRDTVPTDVGAGKYSFPSFTEANEKRASNGPLFCLSRMIVAPIGQLIPGLSSPKSPDVSDEIPQIRCFRLLQTVAAPLPLSVLLTAICHFSPANLLHILEN